MATIYKMTRTTGACARTGRPFQAGEPQVTALFDDPETPDALLRRDYHPEAWDPREAMADGGRLVAFWRHEARTGAGDDEGLSPGDLMEMFEQVPDDRDDAAGLRYVLALMLVRQRRLVMLGDAREGLIRVHPKGAPDDVTEVREPDLAPDELERLGAMLADLLDG